MLWILFVLLLIIGGSLLLFPLLISTRPIAGLGSARSAAIDDSRFVVIPCPGTDGIEVHYLSRDGEGGDGPAFLLLHGFTFNAFTWDRVLDLFGGMGRVVAYDQVPYGLSAKLVPADWRGPNPYTKEAAIEQLFALMDTLGLQRVTLVGNSSGGTLALEAALTRPERVERLILVAPWVYVRRPTISRRLAALPQMRRLSLLIARKLGRAGLLDYCYADPDRIDAERRRRTNIHTRVANWDIAWGELMNRSLSTPVTVSGQLAQVTQPVLLVSGDRDRLVPLADTQKVAAALPNATLAVLPGCGHVPQEECPEQFAQVVRDWLGSERGASVAGEGGKRLSDAG
jgi:pimeloyl-ACP methyl ester carboxylesterase